MSILYTLAAATIDPGSIGITKTNASGTFNGLLTAVYAWAGVVAVIIIIIAGFYYVTSVGRPDKIKQAKNAILGAVIGLVVIIAAFTITQVVLGRFK